MVAALLHLQPTSARSAQCRSRREVPVSFDQLPLCGPQCCSSSLATTALAYKRLRRARKAHYAPPSFPTCRCKLRYFSQSLEPQAKSYRPGRRTRRTCRRAGAGRSHPRRAAQHAGARRRLAMPPHGARGARHCGGRRQRRRAGGIRGAGAPHSGRRCRGHAPLLQVRTRWGQLEGQPVHVLPSHPNKSNTAPCSAAG